MTVKKETLQEVENKTMVDGENIYCEGGSEDGPAQQDTTPTKGKEGSPEEKKAKRQSISTNLKGVSTTTNSGAEIGRKLSIKETLRKVKEARENLEKAVKESPDKELLNLSSTEKEEDDLSFKDMEVESLTAENTNMNKIANNSGVDKSPESYNGPWVNPKDGKKKTKVFEVTPRPCTLLPFVRVSETNETVEKQSSSNKVSFTEESTAEGKEVRKRVSNRVPTQKVFTSAAEEALAGKRSQRI